MLRTPMLPQPEQTFSRLAVIEMLEFALYFCSLAKST